MIKMIVAVDGNYGIGYKNSLLFRVKEDLKRFKELTLGSTILMGRKTFESLPKPLPNRFHVVLTRHKPRPPFIPLIGHYIDESEINGLIAQYKESSEDLWVIGGAEVYKLFIPYTHEIYLTHINKYADRVDTYFPYQEMFDEGFLIDEIENIYSAQERCFVSFFVYRKPS